MSEHENGDSEAGFGKVMSLKCSTARRIISEASKKLEAGCTGFSFRLGAHADSDKSMQPRCLNLCSYSMAALVKSTATSMTFPGHGQVAKCFATPLTAAHHPRRYPLCDENQPQRC